ncbi:hypothetical protein LRD69_24045 [Streptomyces sp. JH14]|uniref:hypothetical protein n=1 Tax=Streptomyces sp. JH14 TaxID=2793630 RepID=UPI0023F68919|nr:hypothetical protein [Streptomyces sp. JH14]MDF6045164.1 hypothetical protein [Streptomyces sp. JH14]
MGSGHRRAGTARLIAVCVALLGLFLMHGAPASAAGGCHEGMTAAAAPSAEHAAHTGSGSAAAAADTAVVHHFEAAAPKEPAVADSAAGVHGTSCVSTAPRVQIPLPAGALVLAIAITLLAAGSLHAGWTLGRTGRRGPPGGRPLLLNVCIART